MNIVFNFSLAVSLLVTLVFSEEAEAHVLKSKKSDKTKVQKIKHKKLKKANTKNENEPCMKVILTGTIGGPLLFNGLAGPGTLVTYGTEGNDCSDLKMQVDFGRGTTLRLSELGIVPNDIDAAFITHMHSDHTDDLSNFMQYRWHFLGQPIDVVCSEDVAVFDRTMSCTQLVSNIDAAFKASGEIDQRLAENSNRNPGGPSALGNVSAFPLTEDPEIVWESPDGAVQVEAIRVNHIGGSCAFRFNTPAGNVTISGMAANDSLDMETRPHSTSDNVEKIANGSNLLVHSVVHPILGPTGGSGFPPPLYARQSNAPDIGSLAERAGVPNVMLYHLLPALNNPLHAIWEVPGGALKKEDYKDSIFSGGYSGNVYVGGDLLTIKLPME
mmetsp:Transcript_46029/g.89921  ORF Transcript_46029/g.89921 Transcript_46029/m.89921 type:complete len:384 (+) Transcript_46029:127-1278(+)